MGQIAVVFGSLALVRVLTEWLTPEQYGQLALGLTMVSLFGQVVFGGLGAGVGRFYSVAAESNDLHGYLAATRRLTILAAMAALSIGLVVAVGVKFTGHTQWFELSLAATLLAVLSGCNGMLNGVQTAARQRGIVALHSTLDAWLKIILALGLMLSIRATSTVVVLGFSLSAFTVANSQLYFLRKTIVPRALVDPMAMTSDWIQRIWAYSWPFSAWGVFTWVQQVSDRWALGLYGGTHDVGLYAVVFQLGYTPISIVLGIAVTFLAPILYQRAGDATSLGRIRDVHQIVWRTTFTALALTGLAALGAAVLHEWLFGVLVSAKFREFSYLLPWVVLAGGLFSAGQMLSLKLMSEMKSHELLLPKIITALFGVAANMIGVVIAGANGVVTAMTAFSAVYLAWMILLAWSSGSVVNKLESVQP